MKVFDIMNEGEILYYIAIKRYSGDRNVSKELNISYRKYVNILKKYNAFKHTNNEYYFSTMTDAYNCFNSKELQPYVIMNKLL